MKSLSKTVVIGARIHQETAGKIDKAVENGLYLTSSSFVKQAIERELSRIEVKKVK